MVASKFRNAGQVCISPTRFIVQQAVYERFLAGFTARAQQWRVGNGLEADVQMGPMANPRRPEAMERLIGGAVSAGRACTPAAGALARRATTTHRPCCRRSRS